MTTKELINKIALQTGNTKKQTEMLLATTAKVITQALKDDKTVVLQNFGSLEPKERQARQVVNPRTGTKSITSAKRVVSFRVNATLKDKIK